MGILKLVISQKIFYAKMSRDRDRFQKKTIKNSKIKNLIL